MQLTGMGKALIAVIVVGAAGSVLWNVGGKMWGAGQAGQHRGVGPGRQQQPAERQHRSRGGGRQHAVCPRPGGAQGRCPGLGRQPRSRSAS